MYTIKNTDGADIYVADPATNAREAVESAVQAGANLRDANLRGADLGGAYLSGAHFIGADLRGADLRDANLTNAYLTGADLSDANLRDANLRGADLSGADLRYANLLNCTMPSWLICPESGSFVAYKAVEDCFGNKAVLRIRVDAETARINGIGSRKCRAERVFVLGLESAGAIADAYWPSTKRYVDPECHYKIGEYTVADNYDDDPRKECTGGIHFFMTKAEAEAW